MNHYLARRNDCIVGAALKPRSLLAGTIRCPPTRIDRGPVFDDVDDLFKIISALLSKARGAGIVRLPIMPCWEGAASRTAEILHELVFLDVQTFDGSQARSLRSTWRVGASAILDRVASLLSFAASKGICIIGLTDFAEILVHRAN